MKTSLFLCFILFLFSCQPVEKNNDISSDQARNDIAKVLASQQESWNEADIDGFMEGYWNSEELSFIGSRGVTKGWQQTLENYKKSYPDKSAMGRLEFETISLDSISNSAYQMVGKYTLYREEDQPSGYFTLLWKYIDDRWVIVADQTCG